MNLPDVLFTLYVRRMRKLFLRDNGYFVAGFHLAAFDNTCKDTFYRHNAGSYLLEYGAMLMAGFAYLGNFKDYVLSDFKSPAYRQFVKHQFGAFNCQVFGESARADIRPQIAHFIYAGGRKQAQLAMVPGA
jgi:hypothetical protein